jgi:hypothetical protein
MKGDLLMTTPQDIQRAGLRALMADPALGIPDYSADPKVVGRVGKIIGETAAHDERHVRASDGRVRSTDPVSADKIHRGPDIWLWSVSVCTLSCTALLGTLAYWRIG